MKQNASNFRSSQKDLESILSAEKEGNIGVLWSSQEYFLQRVYVRLKESADRKKAKSVQKIYGQDIKSKSDLDHLFFDKDLFLGRRTYFIQNADSISALAGILKQYRSVKKVANNVYFTFTWNKQNLTKSKLFSSLGLKVLHVVPPRYGEIKEFVKSLASEKGLRLSYKAVDFIIEQVGEDFYLLENELDKIALIYSGTQGISRELCIVDLVPFLSGLKQEHVFELTDFLLKHQYQHAHILIEQFAERNESPIALLGILARHFRIGIKMLENGGTAPSMPHRIADKYRSWLKPYRGSTILSQALNRCQNYDILMKSQNKVASFTLLSDIIEASRPV